LFLCLETLVPLASAIRLGADEDFELSKTLLYLKGFHLYSEVWVDQPPLYTCWLAWMVRHAAIPILGARLLTVGLALLLLGSLFRLCLNLGNLRTAVGAVAFVIAAPGFLELASSCMNEVPTLALVVTAFALLSRPDRPRRPWLEAGAGFGFALALQMKLIALIYLPLAGFLLWLPPPRAFKPLLLSACVLGLVAGLGFVLLNALTGYGLGMQMQQSWASHFAPAQSLEYGSPAEHAFDPRLLVRNWDVVVPAFVAAGCLLIRLRSGGRRWFPVAWLALTLAVVSTHRPWWPCYYLHNALPLCWCAALAVDAVLTWAGSRPGRIALVTLWLLGAGAWMGMRSGLQIANMRHTPRLFNSPLLTRLQHYQPYTQYLFTLDGVYSFHAGSPLPPSLAEISLKRLWSGDMTNARLAAELTAIKPGLILVASQTAELPYQDLLQAEYRLVYQDQDHQLYVLKSVLKQAPR
jgi:hypothetical protein